MENKSEPRTRESAPYQLYFKLWRCVVGYHANNQFERFKGLLSQIDTIEYLNTNKHGTPILTMAAQWGHLDFVTLLLEKGANVNVWQLAQPTLDKDIIRVLLEAGSTFQTNTLLAKIQKNTDALAYCKNLVL